MPMLTLPNHGIRLATRIIQSAALGDEQRLDTAIREALDTYPVADAMEYVFDPAIACLNSPARHRASVAIGGHLTGEPLRGVGHSSRRSRGGARRAGTRRAPRTPGFSTCSAPAICESLA
jgi:hypothetical protein